MHRDHVLLMASVLVSLSAVVWAGDRGQVVMAQPDAEAIVQADTAVLMEEAERLRQYGIQQLQRQDIDEVVAGLQAWRKATEIYRLPEVRAAFPQESRQREDGLLEALVIFFSNFLIHHPHTSSMVYPEMTALLGQRLSLVSELGDRAKEVNVLNTLGHLHGSQGEFQQALNIYEQSLALTSEINDCAGEGRVLGNIGIIYSALGQYQQAINFGERSLVTARETGDRSGEGQALEALSVKQLIKINYIFLSKLTKNSFDILNKGTPTAIGIEFNPVVLHEPPKNLNQIELG